MITFNNIHNFLEGLALPARAGIEAVSTFRNLPQGSVVSRAGDPCDRIYQIVRGELKISSCSHDGREVVAVMMRAGDWTGLSELFAGLPSAADLVALTPVRLRSIGRADIEMLMARYPELCREVLRVMGLRVCMLYHLNVDRCTLSLKERVVKTLYVQALSHGRCIADHRRVVLALSQDELSKLMATSRQNLNKVLKDLEREGLIELTYGGVCLRALEPIREHYGYLVDVNQPAAVYED